MQHSTQSIALTVGHRPPAAHCGAHTKSGASVEQGTRRLQCSTRIGGGAGGRAAGCELLLMLAHQSAGILQSRAQLRLWHVLQQAAAAVRKTNVPKPFDDIITIFVTHNAITTTTVAATKAKFI